MGPPKEKPMAQLMFRCPYTNKPIRSGIELVAENLKRLSVLPVSVQCPHCGIQHHGAVGCLVEERAPLLAPQDP
jgi:hypothetical protein